MNLVPSALERRRFTRLPFSSNVTFEHGGAFHPAALVDVSLHGALIEAPSEWHGAVGDPVTLAMPLDTGATVISMQTRIAHRSGTRAGLCCVGIDIDSMIHLRRLMELNTSDLHLFEREFVALLE